MGDEADMYGDLPPSVTLQNSAAEQDIAGITGAPEPAAVSAPAEEATPATEPAWEAEPEQSGQVKPAQCNVDSLNTTGTGPGEASQMSGLGGSDGTTPQKLFLGGLPWETNEDAIMMYFGQFGHIIDCMVLRDNATGKSRGFGFVTVSGNDLATKLLDMHHELDGRTLTVRRASPKQSGGGQQQQQQQQQQVGCCTSQIAGAQASLANDGTEKKIFLGGLDRSISDQMIRQACEMHGTVIDIQVMGNSSNPSGRGYGFVTFTDAEPAQKLISVGSMDICGRVVNVSRAQPKGGRNRMANRACGGGMGNMGCCGMGGFGACGMGCGMGGCFGGAGSCRGPGMGCCSMGAMGGCSGCGMGGLGGCGMGGAMGGCGMGAMGAMGSCGGMGAMGCGGMGAMGGLGGLGVCGAMGNMGGMGGCGMGNMGNLGGCGGMGAMGTGGMGMGMGGNGCGSGGGMGSMSCGAPGNGTGGCCNSGGGGGGYGPERTQRTNVRQSPY